MDHKEAMIAKAESMGSKFCPRCGIGLIDSDGKVFQPDHSKELCDFHTPKTIHFIEALEAYTEAVQFAYANSGPKDTTRRRMYWRNAKKSGRALFALTCGRFEGSGIENRFNDLLGG